MGILRPGKYTFGNKTKTEISNLTNGLALTGTNATINFGDTTITGVGTLFTQQLFVNNLIKISNSVFKVTAITSNTLISIDGSAQVGIASGNSINLLNPKGIKKGDSVYNITDRMPMYYSGDNITFNSTFGALNTWLLGTWVNGQISPMKMTINTSSILEGNVLTTSSFSYVSVNPYSNGNVDFATCVAYFSILNENSCVATANCGIHNTDSSGAIAKGNFTKPSLSVSTPAVVLDSTTSASGDSCGVACTSTGTPAAGELEMLVNFQERL
jgi:hypothetical protein